MRLISAGVFSLYLASALLAFAPARATLANDAPSFRPGWLPVNRLDDETRWKDVREIEDKVQLYFPRGDEPVRGVYVSVVFHSGDPREMARQWDFALVTIPWHMLWDVGLPDKGSRRQKETGLEMGDMGVLLDYLKRAAKKTGHPELDTAPIVAWLMQGGYHHAPGLMERCPERVIAWCDSFPKQLAKHPEVYTKIPFALAWEFKDEKQRLEERAAHLPEAKGKPTPAPDLRCQASTYGFPHGVYSKWNFFQAYLDRVIRARMPDEMPKPGQPVQLKPVDKENGWCADFNEMSEWVAIAPFREAKGMVAPQWLPDEYAAWMYRSYHSANPDIKLTAPQKEYKSGGGPGYGLGYGNEVKAGTPLTFSAKTTGDYIRFEYHDGNRIVGTADVSTPEVTDIRLDRGLHTLFAVGVKADGSRTASRPAFVVVE